MPGGCNPRRLAFVSRGAAPPPAIQLPGWGAGAVRRGGVVVVTINGSGWVGCICADSTYAHSRRATNRQHSGHRSEDELITMLLDRQLSTQTVQPTVFAVLRCYARWGDYLIPFLLLRLWLRPLGMVDFSSFWDWYLAFAAAIVMNALQLACFGSTIHKALIGLRVCMRNGRKPSFLSALMREVYATLLGIACGVPVLIPLAMTLSAISVLEGRRTIWDRKWHLHIRFADEPGFINQPTRFFRRIFCLILFLTETGLAIFVAARYQAGFLFVGC